MSTPTRMARCSCKAGGKCGVAVVAPSDNADIATVPTVMGVMPLAPMR